MRAPSPATMTATRSHDFDAWAEGFAAEWIRRNPQAATRAQYFSGDEADALDRRLALTDAYGSTFGKRAADEYADLAHRGLDELAAFPREALGPVARVSAAVIERSLRDAVANAQFAQHRFVFSQMTGLQSGLVHFMATTHPLKTSRDGENYVARLAQMAPVLDEGIAEAAAAQAAGIVPPSFILERTIEQIDGLLGVSPERNVLAARCAQLPVAARAEEEVRTSVLPAFARVRDFLASQLPHATDAAGAWALPRGEEFYAQALATLAGTALSASEIHELGLREVGQIEAQIDRVLGRLGYTSGSIPERIAQVAATLRPRSDPDPREEIVAQVGAVVDDAAVRAESMFNLMPASRCIVEREPAFSEKTAAAHYLTPAADGSRPGIYFIPLPVLDPMLPWLGAGLRSTAYHEAVPGHHFQLALEQESPTLPYFRKRSAFGYRPEFGEGWALYAERLAAEAGWYDGDDIGLLGYLQAQLFRARRLVVDTGLHAFRWTRQQAIDYGIPVSEVERYVAWPGQACSYMLGQLRIVEIRERARAALGDAFSLMAFHDVVLSGGTMPLDLLETEVDRWARGAGSVSHQGKPIM